jgi:hypothetical protein
MTVLTRILAGLGLLAIAIALIGSGDLAFADTVGPPVGAPGPIGAAGLPYLAAVGYGAYRLVKRFRRKSD